MKTVNVSLAFLLGAFLLSFVLRACYPLDATTVEQCQAIVAGLESPLVFKPYDYAEAVEHCNVLNALD